jgi:hypothetical protein
MIQCMLLREQIECLASTTCRSKCLGMATAPMQRRNQQKCKKEGKKKGRETNYMRVVERVHGVKWRCEMLLHRMCFHENLRCKIDCAQVGQML